MRFAEPHVKQKRFKRRSAEALSVWIWLWLQSVKLITSHMDDSKRPIDYSVMAHITLRWSSSLQIRYGNQGGKIEVRILIGQQNSQVAEWLDAVF